MFKKYNSLFIIFLLFIFSPLVYPVDSIAGNKGPDEAVRRIPDVKELRKKGYTDAEICQQLGTSGTKKVAFVLVNFSTTPGNDGATSGASVMTSSDVSYVQDAGLFLNDFFQASSYNKLNIQAMYFWDGGMGTLLNGSETPYQLTSSMSYYGSPKSTEGRTDDHYGTKLLIEETLAKTPLVLADSYDTVVIVHAGYGEETTQKTGDIWSTDYPLATPVNGFTRCIVIPARELGADTTNFWNVRFASTRGTLCHEYGHELGLPNLYSNTSNWSERQRIGRWCLMDSGGFNISADGEWAYWFPSFPSAWCRQRLGWISPVVISSATGQVRSWSIETRDNTSPEKSLYSIPVLNSDNEYFLVNHSTFAWFRDSSLGAYYYVDQPWQGLLIWHIDETVTSNDGASRLMVALEPAGTSYPSVNGGDETNPWFTGEFPLSRSFSNTGATSYVKIVLGEGLEGFYSVFSSSAPKFCAVTGHVRDLGNKGIDSVEVDFSGLNKISAKTDASGLFSCTMMEGFYMITASKAGYKIIPPVSSFTVTSDYEFQDNFIALIDKFARIAQGDLKMINNIFNPLKGEVVTFLFNLSQPGDITYEIYSLDGTEVKKASRYFDKGVNVSLQWDGMNENGAGVASGIYLVKIDGPGISRTGKICVIR